MEDFSGILNHHIQGADTVRRGTPPPPVSCLNNYGSDILRNV